MYAWGEPADATEHNQPQTPRGCENIKLGHLSRADLGLGWRGWQELNIRLCFKTQVPQEGMASAGVLANHSPRTVLHLTIHNHRRRKDWQAFVVQLEAPLSTICSLRNEYCQLMFKKLLCLPLPVHITHSLSHLALIESPLLV